PSKSGSSSRSWSAADIAASAQLMRRFASPPRRASRATPRCRRANRLPSVAAYRTLCAVRENAMKKQRISYVPLERMDVAMRHEMERCQREGTPRPESSAVRAHVPAAFWFFANSWNDLFRNGVADHVLKELCRLYVSRSVQCEYCGNQRSVKSTQSGALIEDHVLDLLNFEKSTCYNEGQKAALSYAEAI